MPTHSKPSFSLYQASVAGMLVVKKSGTIWRIICQVYRKVETTRTTNSEVVSIWLERIPNATGF